MRLKLLSCVCLASWMLAGAGWGQPKSESALPKFEIDSLDLQLGYTDLDVDGNRFKFEQYSTPEDGLVLRRLWLYGGRPGIDTVAADLYQPGATDNSLNFSYYTPWPVARFRATYTTWQEHLERTVLTVRRRNPGLFADVPLFHGVFLQGQYTERGFSRSNGLEFPEHTFTLYPDYLLKDYGVGLSAPIGSTELRLAERVVQFTDGSGYQPGSFTDEHTVELGAAIAPNTSGTLSFSDAKTKVGFRPLPAEQDVEHRVYSKVVRLDVQSAVREDTVVRGYLAKSDMTRGFSRSGYAKRVQAGGIRAAFNGIPRLYVRAGFDKRDVDYLTAERDAILNPKVETAWVSARYRPVQAVELSARLSNRKRTGLPDALNPNGQIIEPPFVPRDSSRTEYGVSYSPGGECGLSYRYMQEREHNPYREMTYRIQLNDFIGWAQVNGRLSVTATYGEHRYRSRFIEAAGFLERLQTYLSDAKVHSLGIGYTINRNWWIDAFYSRSRSLKAEDVQEKIFTLSAHTRLSRDSEGILEYSAQNFDDRRNGLNDYDADLVSFWWKTKL
ncbi:MAG: hypothetical protein IT210_11110 [Armatimonadetes bacterium]|nr:hypothetical protein [Armatimonadota bacterium]